MRRYAWIVLLWSLPALARRGDAPPPDPKASPETLLRGIAEDDFLVRDDLVGEAAARYRFIEPGKVLGELALAKAPWKSVVARIATDEKLPTKAAEPLARALVRWKAFRLHFQDAPKAEIEADFEATLRESRGALAPFASAASYFRYDGRGAGAARWIAMVERLAPDLPVVPQRLVELAPVEPWSGESLLFAVERDPKLLLDAVLAERGEGDAALLPSYDAALGQLLAKATPAKTAQAVDVANAKLSVLLGAGLAPQAVSAFQALPETVREGVISRETPERAKYGRTEMNEGGPQLALNLGAAFLLTGDREMAASLFYRAVGRTRETAQRHEDNRPGLLEAALKPERDPFEVLIFGASGPLWTQVALVAARDYPEFTARLVGTDARERRYSREDDDPVEGRRVHAATQAFDAQVAALSDELRKKAESDTAPAPAPDALSAKLRQLLDAPARRPCTERPVRPEAAKGWTSLPAEASGFFSLAAAKKDRDAVAVYASQRLDPTGEVSRGGYWFARSLDGGAKWSRPTYLGLREMRPYQLSADALPRFEGESLVLTATVREIDEDKITFPPIRLPAKRESGPVELVCPLAELEKDRDGDGLSDLVEERIVTDPENADTDGDGIRDGQDPLPQVPADGKPSLRGVLLFRALTERPPHPGIIVGPFESAVGPSELADDARTVFLSTDRESLAGTASENRTIVLSEEELALASKKFGAFYPRHAPFVATNHAGTIAFVQWSTGWSGGEYLLRKRSDGWHVEVISSWIT